MNPIRVSFVFFSALLLIPCTSVAKDRHAPLPAKVLGAKTVYIDNEMRTAPQAIDEIQKWGRFKVVDSADKADLVLRFSADAYDGGYVKQGSSHTSGTVSTNTNSFGTSQDDVDLKGSSSSRKQHVRYTHLTLINPKTGANLWSNKKQWGGWRSATRGLVRELRDRFNEQEKAR